MRYLFESIYGELSNVLRMVFGLETRRGAFFVRRSFAEALVHARRLGLTPSTVIDVGAAHGTFALKCHRIFPGARYILIEPLKEYGADLERVSQTIPNSEYIVSVAAARQGQVSINVHPDLAGSSLYLENEGSDVNGFARTVMADTIDNFCKDRNAIGPYLIKADVQGGELEVLSGAKGVLKETEYAILEVSLFEFFVGGPQFYEVVHYMKSCGFVVYDIFDIQYRPYDDAMSQVDLAFVRENGRFRRQHIYATREQREAQTRRFQRSGKGDTAS